MSQLFADPADMLRVVPDKSLTRVTTTQRVQFLQDASDEAASALDQVFTLPLVSWSQELRRDVATVACYESLAAQGFDSADFGSSLLRRADRVRALWKTYAAGATPAGIVDSSVDVDEGAPSVVTSPKRGWSR